MASPGNVGLGAEATPPPEPVKPWIRYKWPIRFVLAANVAMGAYLLFSNDAKQRGKLKVEHPKRSEKKVVSPDKTAAVTEESTLETTTEPIPAVKFVPRAKPPVTPEQQREILQYILDEKRKLKPRTKKEKAKLNEEKALLKHLLRSGELPAI